MASEMTLPESQQAGFALAATIARDPGAARARAGLAPGAVEGWCALASDLEHCSKAERRALIRRIARPEPADLTPRAGRSARALALLAGREAHARGAPAGHTAAALGWPSDPAAQGQLPLPRPGFVPEPGLLALLARIARASRSAPERSGS